MKKWIISAATVCIGLAAWGTLGLPEQTKVTPVKSHGAKSELRAPSRMHSGAMRAPGTAFTLPVTLTPSTSEAANFIILDCNGDEKTWKHTGAKMQYSYHGKNNADDWFFIPIALQEADGLLKVSYKAQVQSKYPECFEVAFGAEPTPAAMQVFEDVDDFMETKGKAFSSTVAITPMNGTGYIGFHCNSTANQYLLFISEISISSIRGAVPLDPVISTSSINELEYSATINIPSGTLQGNPIQGNVGLRVDVDGVETENYPDCAPGATKDVALTLSKGAHIITFTAYLDTDGTSMYSNPVSEEVYATNPSAPLALPVVFEPTAEDFEECVVIDANNDGTSWDFNNSSFRYYYSPVNQADDWLILPVIDFGEDNGTFDLSLEAHSNGTTFTETFEICVSRTPDVAGMTVVLSPEAVSSQNYVERSGKFHLAEGGKWYLAVHVTTPKDQFELHIRNLSISRSADITPMAPEIKNVDLDGLEGKVTLTLPTKTVDDVDIATPVGAVLWIDGVEYAVTETATAGSDITIPVTLTLGRHTLAAAAFVEENGSRLVSSQTLTEVLAHNPEGYAYPIPFTMHPTLGEFQTLTIVDANNDGNTWDYNSGAANGTGAAVCRTQGEETSDDWLFFPPVEITDVTRIYNVSVEARAYLEQFPEDFDLCIGTAAAPDAMTSVVSADGFKTYLYNPVKGEWIAPAAGKYVVGIHRRSSGSAHTLSIMNVSVTDAGKSVLAPAQCENIDAAGDASGAPVANVSLTLPVNAINGSALDTSASLTVTVTSASGASASATGLPGAELALQVAAPEGSSTLTVVAASELYGAGEPVQVPVYCGLDIPSAPTVTATVTEDNMGLTLTWTDSGRGENGGAINTASLAHTIYTPVDASGLYWNPVAEVPAGQNSYTFSADLLQSITIIGVSATNSKGTSQLGLGYGVTGTPYSLPMTEDLSGGAFSYSPVSIETPDGTYSQNWFLDKPGLIYPALGEDETNALMCIESSAPVAPRGRVSLPKFTTVDAHKMQLTMRVYDAPQAADAAVYAVTFGAEPVKVGEIAGKGSAGWKEHTFNLPESLLGKKWVNLFIEATFDAAPQAFVLQSYSIRSTYDRQLSVRLSAPSEMHLGETYTVKATVTNGSLTAQGLPAFTLTSTVGETVETLEPNAPAAMTLEPDASTEILYTLAPTADMLGSMRLDFALTGYTDEVPEDNADYAEVSITTGGRPVVTDLDGTVEDNALRLTWSAPEQGTTGQETFESYEPFDYSSNLGAWLNLDLDGKKPYAISDQLDYPGDVAPKAFQVINAPALGIDLEAYSGEQYLLAVCPEDATAADDWLISPEVVGGSTVSFRFNVLSSAYGTEQIDLLYSTTGREPSDFRLLQTYSQNMRGWNPLEKKLPDDARYFAFHYRSVDIFGVALDDIFYTPLSEAPIAGYHVYRNGERIAEKHPETALSLTSWEKGDRFNVSAVADCNGTLAEHPMSNTYIATGSSDIQTVTTLGRVVPGTGEVTFEGLEGQQAVIYTPDGVTAASVASLGATERVILPAGIYIVTLDEETTVKIRVK